MKKFYLILFFLLLNIMHSYSQESGKIVYLKEFRAKGVVLPISYKPPYNLSYIKERIEPTKKDLVLTECLIRFYWDSLIFSDSYKYKELKYWRRQYFFYLSNDNKKIATVYLLNFKNKRKAKKNFINWENEFINGFGDFYESNVIKIAVNLTDLTIEPKIFFKDNN